MDTAFRQSLKARAHHLKPVIQIGAKGLTQAVIDETNVALQAHELIKVKIYGVEKEDRQPMFTEICETLNAELIQLIGNIAVIYRPRED